MNTVLRQIAHMRVPRQQHTPVIRLLHPHDTLHEGRLTCSVLARKSNALSVLHHEGKRIEEHARTILDMQVLDGKNHR